MRAGEARQRVEADPGCDRGIHHTFLELDLWGEVFDEFVLPERHPCICAAIHEAAIEKIGALDATMPALRAVCPEPHEDRFPPRDEEPLSAELLAVRRLAAARDSGTASGLDAALRAVLALPDEGARGHARCDPYEVLVVGWALFRALREVVPVPHRGVLAGTVQRSFYRRYAPNEEPPTVLYQEPFWLSEPGSRYSFTAVWVTAAGEGRSGRETGSPPGPWFAPEHEAILQATVAALEHR